ncbi:MAG: hypothetical protein ABFE13_10185 [Phycisphaerales bacterium]
MPLWRNVFLKSLKSRVFFSPPLRRIVMQLGLRSMTLCGLNSTRLQ